MAHFAELDSNNKVLRVIVVDNANVPSDMHADGETWCANNIPEDPAISYVNGSYPGIAWKQTSYNHNFRKRFACIDGYFVDDGGDGYFTAIKPHDNWVLNTTDGAYYEPVARPTVTTYTEGSNTFEYDIRWDQDNTRWICSKVHSDGSTYIRNRADGGDDGFETVTNPSADLTQIRVWDPDTSSWS